MGEILLRTLQCSKTPKSETADTRGVKEKEFDQDRVG